MAVPLLLVVIVGAGVWLVFSGSRAVAAVTDLQDSVDDLQAAITAADLAAVESAALAAQDAALRADDALDDPVWAAVAAVPYLGDTAEAARVTADAVAVAATGLDPLLDVADVLDPASLYVDGRVDVDRLEQAQAPLAQAAAALAAADETMASAPTAAEGAWVVDPIDAQRQTAADQLSDAAEAMGTASAAADVLPALLGADGPRTWFVGIQSPGEARGTGGVIGTHVILTADDGRLALDRTASNSELGRLETLPDFGDQFEARYDGFPTFIGSSNISPHFPYAGALWREYYAKATGTEVDAVMGTDVVAFGDLIDATGPITLPDGRTLNGDQAVDFALIGVYEAYPNSAEREDFQEAVAEAVFTQLTSGQVQPDTLVGAVTSMVRENRLLLWSPDEQEQEALLRLPTAGSVAAEPGPYAYPVVINATGSKLDSYLAREFVYEAGRCEIAERVLSRLTMTLESAIPDGEDIPDYVISQAERTPAGPVSRVQLQIHLSPDAAIDDVTVDGEPAAPYAFREQGRPALVLGLDLPPRVPVTVSIELNEPATDLPAVVPDQPLATAADITVVDVPCELPD